MHSYESLSSDQRGFLEGWILYAVVAIAVLAALTGLVMAWNSYTEGLIQGGYERGVAVTKAAYVERDLQQMREFTAKVKALEAEKEKLEGQWKTQVAEVEAKRLKEKKDAKARYDRDLADARSGAIVLRDPGSTSGACVPSSSGSTTGETPATVSGSDGKTGSQLSPEATARLLGYANEADDIVRQLGSAQELIEQYYGMCGS